MVAAVSPIENVPDAEKDWQPRSNNQVLSLVHPYLYPIDYNRTFAKVPRASRYRALKPPGGDEYYFSQRFQWLPSDFAVAEDGSVTLASPYINNIHPQKHAALESVVPKLLERAIPLWEHVLSDLRRPLLPFRTKSAVGNPLPDCIFEGVAQLAPEDEEVDVDVDVDVDTWLSAMNLNLPDAKELYARDLDVMKTPTVSLKGTTIQCIIKLVNIMLTPEKPEYPGGNWHVEGLWTTKFMCFGCGTDLRILGMENERVVSSFIYVSPFTNHGIPTQKGISQSTMAVKISPRPDWHSGGQCVNQSTTDGKVKTIVSVFYMGSRSESVLRRHCVGRH